MTDEELRVAELPIDELMALHRDAMRYRWIAAHGGCPFSEQDMTWADKEKLDARIDECIAKRW